MIHQILDMEEIRFSLKSVFMVDVRFELTTNDPWSVDDAICEGISPLGYLQRSANRLPKLSLITHWVKHRYFGSSASSQIRTSA